MKNIVFIVTLLLTFASGYLIASSLAASSPVLLEVAAVTENASCTQDDMIPAARVSKTVDLAPLQAPELQAEAVDTTSKSGPVQHNNPAELTLNDYSNTIAEQLPAATQLVIRIDDNEFQQLLANHQQQAAGDLAALEYQHELADYLAEQHNLTVLELDCRADLCLLELDIHDDATWPQLFAALSSQSWWQSVSYQSTTEVGSAHRLLLQQNIGQDLNQTAMLPDDGAMQ